MEEQFKKNIDVIFGYISMWLFKIYKEIIENKNNDKYIFNNIL